MDKAELEALQKRRLEEIGTYLCQIRKGRVVSIDWVTMQTKIQKHQLSAIEQGDLSNLPPAVYVKGFIKLYANALGCNGMEIAAMFPVSLKDVE